MWGPVGPAGDGVEPDEVEATTSKLSELVVTTGHDREKKKRSKDVVVDKQFEDVDFSDMQISEDIIKGLRLCRYEKPTPIQLRALPLGRLSYDLLLQAKSGTGKTCVFTVCILQQVDITKLCIQALVVSPCREIAVQIAHVIKSIGAFKNGLKVKEFIGGTTVEQSVRRTTNCHIAVGTPGRLAHMINEYQMDFSKLKVVALDEADKLMDASFFDDIKVIFKALPQEKQMIATSATYSDVVVRFLEKFMKNACKIQLDLDNPTLCAVDQYLMDAKSIIGKGDPIDEMDEGFNIKLRCLKEILRRVVYNQAIIFSNFQLRAEAIFEALKDLGWDVDLLSASRSQEDRLIAFSALQNKKIKALVATDVASRGLDFEGVDMVINFDIPRDRDTYVHRVGRTGRFGSVGRTLSICYFDSDRNLLAEYQLNLQSTLWLVENLQGIDGINEKARQQHTTRQLKGIPDYEFDEDDSDDETWREKVEEMLDRPFEDDCIEDYMVNSMYMPTDLYSQNPERRENVERIVQEFKIKKAEAKAKRLALQASDATNIHDALQKDNDGEINPFSSEEEDSEEEEEAEDVMTWVS